MKPEAFDSGRALAGLKDFQRRTVDYVFRRFWVDEPAATRFLVADEVGLGKTMVARGIIAKTLDHLRGDVERINIVYVCSNAAIAHQNVARLNVLNDKHVSFSTRLTLLPLQLRELSQNRVNFVSFSPGTALDLKSKGGRMLERALVFQLLAQDFPSSRPRLMQLLRANAQLESFKNCIRQVGGEVDRELAARFLERVRQEPELLAQMADWCDTVSHRAQNRTDDGRREQMTLIGRCRQLLATVSLDALEPDLVILDEFQRFRDLLDGEDEASQLARSLMSYRTPQGRPVRVLLLSATPYKALTLGGEDEDHYRDFSRTVGFLLEDPAKRAELEENLRAFRQGLYAGEPGEVQSAGHRIRNTLRAVMARTERTHRTADGDAMLRTTLQSVLPRPSDLGEANVVHQVALATGSGEPVEYWKSAPYLLHFMKGYQVKKKLEALAKNPPAPLVRALVESGAAALSETRVNRYRELDPGNARLRQLMAEMVEPGQWKVLWVQPSLPYLTPGGAYAQVAPFTKSLVFSSWVVVPDALSAICSYEVERRMLGEPGELPPYRHLMRSTTQLLRFSESGGRLTGMPTLALMYPSVALAQAVDPLRIALEPANGGPAPAARARRVAQRTIEGLLRETGLWPRHGDGPADQRWYWAALAILDRPFLQERQKWLRSAGGFREALGSGEEGVGLEKHIQLFIEAAKGVIDDDLGPAPPDLTAVLAEVALGGPAVCAMRSLARNATDVSLGDRNLAHAAVRVAGGFRTLFNLPETNGLLRAGSKETYWRLVLHHGIDGNLQAVLDEWVHQLREGLGIANHTGTEAVGAMAEQMAEALSLRTTNVHADEIRVRKGKGGLRFRRFPIRTRFALKFGDLQDDQDRTIARIGSVRAAFNSPFRPFVLATTSVGQEGLDFHPYCHAVTHWNLPSNPVDLEQREGRVQRYKGHAVRRNVATKWGLRAVRQRTSVGRLDEAPEGNGILPDPWKALFEAAALDRPAGANELVPYWIYEIEGGAKVERRVPMFPLSREVARLDRLREGLAVYRLAFGQPRQEDLLSFLSRRRRDGEEFALESAGISLEPE